jgi:hypothetical protein
MSSVNHSLAGRRAHAPAAPWWLRVKVRWQAERLDAAEDIEALAADLRAAGSVRAQGVARAMRMFTDGRLYGRTAGELRRCARWAAATL